MSKSYLLLVVMVLTLHLLPANATTLCAEQTPVELELDDRLDKELSFTLTRPLIHELVELISKQTGVPLEVDASITATQKTFGSMAMTNVPANRILMDLAEAQGSDARWERKGTGYILRGRPNLAFVEKKQDQADVAQDEASEPGRFFWGWAALVVLAVISAVYVLALLLRKRETTKNPSSAALRSDDAFEPGAGASG
jgi:hypothetical protein